MKYKCLVPDCTQDTVSIDIGCHHADMLCQTHFDRAEGYFEIAAGEHIFEYNDVKNWIAKGCTYVAPICWKDTGTDSWCSLPRGHEGDCLPAIEEEGEE